MPLSCPSGRTPKTHSPPPTPSASRNHPFVDGNKRTAAVVSEGFLLLGGYALDASDAEVVVAFVALAAGELEEAELVAWFGERVREGCEADVGAG